MGLVLGIDSDRVELLVGRCYQSNKASHLRRLYTIHFGAQIIRDYPAIIETGLVLEVSSFTVRWGARDARTDHRTRTVAFLFTHISHTARSSVATLVTFPREIYTSLKNGGSHHHRTRESQPGLSPSSVAPAPTHAPPRRFD